MTIKDLKDFLSQLPDDMEVVEKRYSDLRDMELSDWSVIDAHRKFGDEGLVNVDSWQLSTTNEVWKLRANQVHPVKKYLYFWGN